MNPVQMQMMMQQQQQMMQQQMMMQQQQQQQAYRPAGMMHPNMGMGMNMGMNMGMSMGMGGGFGMAPPQAVHAMAAAQNGRGPPAPSALSPARNSTMIDGRARPEPAFDFVQDHIQNLKKT